MPSVHAAANADLGQAPGQPPMVDFVQCREHTQSCLDASRGMIGILHRRSEHGQNGIADELDDNALVVVNDFGHVVEISAEQQQRLLGVEVLHNGREARDVREEDRDLLRLHPRLRIHPSAQQDLHDGPRDVLPPGLDRLLHVVEDAVDHANLCATLLHLHLFHVQGYDLHLHDALHLIRERPEGLQQAQREEVEVLREQRDAQQDDKYHSQSRQQRHLCIGLDLLSHEQNSRRHQPSIHLCVRLVLPRILHGLVSEDPDEDEVPGSVAR
mmetsp:Transcript_152080/g.485923  ORF Transcript_152080/g.485923 Transcript_152080/m.485923 type:complete len:270 (-) Transcript_152080:1914-2723(-)